MIYFFITFYFFQQILNSYLILHILISFIARHLFSHSFKKSQFMFKYFRSSSKCIIDVTSQRLSQIISYLQVGAYTISTDNLKCIDIKNEKTMRRYLFHILVNKRQKLIIIFVVQKHFES